MIDRQELTGELARQVTRLEENLRTRAGAVPEVATIVEAEWQRAHAAGRTAHDLATWSESLLTQVAVGWVLGTTFLRFCEDTGLLADPVITGPADRTRRAEDAQRAWFREHPAEGERGYVSAMFRAAATLPGLAHVFEPHNPVWLFGPPDDGVRALLTYWREVVPETGALRRDFTDPGRSPASSATSTRTCRPRPASSRPCSRRPTSSRPSSSTARWSPPSTSSASTASA